MFYSANPEVRALETPARRARAEVVAGLARRLGRGTVNLARLVQGHLWRTVSRQVCNG